MSAFKRYGKGKEYFILQPNLGEASLGILLQHFWTVDFWTMHVFYILKNKIKNKTLK